MQIADVEGIGAAHATRLVAAQIHTDSDLLTAGATRAGRTRLASRTGIPEVRLRTPSSSDGAQPARLATGERLHHRCHGLGRTRRPDVVADSEALPAAEQRLAHLSQRAVQQVRRAAYHTRRGGLDG